MFLFSSSTQISPPLLGGLSALLKKLNVCPLFCLCIPPLYYPPLRLIHNIDVDQVIIRNMSYRKNARTSSYYFYLSPV